MNTAFSVQGFAVVLLFMSTKGGMKGPDGVVFFVGLLLRVGKLRTELFDGLF